MTVDVVNVENKKVGVVELSDAVFGGRVRTMLTGAAPTAMGILEFFWAAGLPIYEAYGMTESTVITHVNRPGECFTT